MCVLFLLICFFFFFFFFSSRRRHTRSLCDWSSDVCSSDLSSPQHSEVKEDISIERALEGVGVGWVKTVDNYRVGEVAKTLKEAMTTDYKGLKVIIAEGECQLERQRKLKPVVAEKLKKGERNVRVKYGVDED